MFIVFWTLAFSARKNALRIGADVHRVYLSCGVWTLFIWLLYPIAWAVCEGGNIIAPDSEAVFYGLLDLCAKPVFSIMLILGHWNIDPARLGLMIGEVEGTNGLAGTTGTTTGVTHREKGGMFGRRKNRGVVDNGNATGVGVHNGTSV